MTHERVAAADRPCVLYADHGSARPSYSQLHHIRPEFLQKRLWGRTVDQDKQPLCGTCHDNLHGHLYWLLGERAAPSPPVPTRARQAAERAHAWYVGAARAEGATTAAV